MSSLAVRRLLRVKHGTRIIGTLPLVEFKISRWADEQYDRFRRDMSAQENI
ncbi:hypothetical protein KQQSB11_260505 [Klebsiella quasipneumoniae subsp. quasipneumoniae]|nr:hypothetical protein KQQSB11_260505 [Klebsiella quasipneumoniae subsp. quasipneumoniae]